VPLCELVRERDKRFFLDYKSKIGFVFSDFFVNKKIIGLFLFMLIFISFLDFSLTAYGDSTDYILNVQIVLDGEPGYLLQNHTITVSVILQNVGDKTFPNGTINAWVIGDYRYTLGSENVTQLKIGELEVISFPGFKPVGQGSFTAYANITSKYGNVGYKSKYLQNTSGIATLPLGSWEQAIPYKPFTVVSSEYVEASQQAVYYFNLSVVLGIALAVVPLIVGWLEPKTKIKQYLARKQKDSARVSC
jgi:hypothetical protein